MPLAELPLLTADVPPIRAAIKRDYTDFVVEEIPAYEASGHGDHIYFQIEKAGLTTMQAVRDVARALGVAPRDIGVAGLKDARAVTRQFMSLEHADPQRIASLEVPRLRVLSVSRHTNKLRIGHLRGNRFTIKLRDADPARLGDIRAIIDTLHRRGTPNYFGSQRFGSRGDTWQMGEALLRGDADRAIHLMCGTPSEADTGDVLEARRLFERGDYEAAARAWPYLFRENAKVCRAMARNGGKCRKALFAVDLNLKKFFISAYQSHLFNQVLAARVLELDRLLPGDLAYKCDNGAVFRVEDIAAEQPRADRFEISPTGPQFGFRMTQPSGAAEEIETRVREAAGVTCEDFGKLGSLRAPGGRRPLRFQVADPAVDAGSDTAGPYIELRFTLPSGCYATSVLREICKMEMEEGPEE